MVISVKDIQTWRKKKRYDKENQITDFIIVTINTLCFGIVIEGRLINHLGTFNVQIMTPVQRSTA